MTKKGSEMRIPITKKGTETGTFVRTKFVKNLVRILNRRPLEHGASTLKLCYSLSYWLSFFKSPEGC